MKNCDLDTIRAIHESYKVFTACEPSADLAYFRERLRYAHQHQIPVGFDTEFDTDDIDACQANVTFPCVISIGLPSRHTAEGRPIYEGFVFVNDGMFLLKKWFAGNSLKVAHNANVDRHVIENLFDAPLCNVWDTMTISRWVEPNRSLNGLKELCWNYFLYSWSDDYKVLWGDAKPSTLVDYPEFLKYAAIDACWVGELYGKLTEISEHRSL